jgi:hypothetical protein
MKVERLGYRAGAIGNHHLARERDYSPSYGCEKRLSKHSPSRKSKDARSSRRNQFVRSRDFGEAARWKRNDIRCFRKKDCEAVEREENRKENRSPLMNMNPNGKSRLISLAVILFAGSIGLAADVPDNLISNGGFEGGLQFWRGDGRIVLQPNGNRVCEIEASKNRMKDVKQEFHLRDLQQVEVIFHARGIKYTGPGIRISIHQFGSGSVFWEKALPEDGSWGDFRILYTRTKANPDLRELNIAALLGTGLVQIDDVEVREPGKVAERLPPRPDAATLPTAPAPFAATPAPEVKRLPPVAMAKPIAPIAPIATPAPAPHLQAPTVPQAVPPGGFGSLEQIFQSAPAAAVDKLKDEATRQAGAAELNDYFSNNVKGRPARFRIKIDETRPEVSTPTAYLVHVSDVPATTWDGSAKLTAWLWVRFSEEPEGVLEKLSKGSESIVSGVISRCLIGKGGKVHLDVDFVQSKIETP